MNLYQLLSQYLLQYPNARVRYGSTDGPDYPIASFVDDERGLDTPIGYTSYVVEGRIDVHLPTYEESGHYAFIHIYPRP